MLVKPVQPLIDKRYNPLSDPNTYVIEPDRGFLGKNRKKNRKTSGNAEERKRETMYKSVN